MSELARPLALRDLTSAPRIERIEAADEERAALARRFDLVALDRFAAVIEARRDDGAVAVGGRVRAAGAQRCVISGLAVPFAIDEAVRLRFVRPPPNASDEIELCGDDLDTLVIEGEAVDLGEAAAQTLGLALDPYPRALDAALAEARRVLVSEEAAAALVEADRVAASPFAVIRGGAA